MMNKEEAKSLLVFILILIAVVAGAFLIAGNPAAQSADSQCSLVGNC